MKRESMKRILGIASVLTLPVCAFAQTDGGVVGAAGNSEQGVVGATGSKATTIEAMADGIAPPTSSVTTSAVFRRLDRNKDGVLSRKEFQSGYDSVIMAEATGPANSRRVIRRTR
jgi:hypothetical protein